MIIYCFIIDIYIYIYTYVYIYLNIKQRNGLVVHLSPWILTVTKLFDTRDTPLIFHRFSRRGGSQTLLKGQMNRQKGATALSNLALAMGTTM